MAVQPRRHRRHAGRRGHVQAVGAGRDEGRQQAVQRRRQLAALRDRRGRLSHRPPKVGRVLLKYLDRDEQSAIVLDRNGVDHEQCLPLRPNS
jgi:hypothetical protein